MDEIPDTIQNQLQHILETEEYDSDALIQDTRYYSNILQLLNDDAITFNLIKEYIYDYKCMSYPCIIKPRNYDQHK